MSIGTSKIMVSVTLSKTARQKKLETETGRAKSPLDSKFVTPKQAESKRQARKLFGSQTVLENKPNIKATGLNQEYYLVQQMNKNNKKMESTVNTPNNRKHQSRNMGLANQVMTMPNLLKPVIKSNEGK